MHLTSITDLTLLLTYNTSVVHPCADDLRKGKTTTSTQTLRLCCSTPW